MILLLNNTRTGVVKEKVKTEKVRINGGYSKGHERVVICKAFIGREGGGIICE